MEFIAYSVCVQIVFCAAYTRRFVRSEAQDKENWEDLISEIGEESKKSKAKKKRKWQWNPLASCGAGCAGK